MKSSTKAPLSSTKAPLSKSVSYWKKKAWKEFAAYIKKRDNFTCITCGKTDLKGVNAQAGHFIPKTIASSLYFSEHCVYCQCFRCNINLGGWGERFAEVLEARRGRKFVKRLRELRFTKIRFTIEGLKAVHERYYSLNK